MWTIVYVIASVFPLLQAHVRPGDEVCVMNASNSCRVDTLNPSALDQSILIYPGGHTRCAYDDFSNPSVNFTTNSTYFFQVFPAPNRSNDKVMLYFQGGGACIDDLTCGFGLQCIHETFHPNARPLSTGILNRSNENNVFKDYNIIHITQCTGDLHMGNHVKTIPDSKYYTQFNTSECLGHHMTVHQVGFVNTKAVLDWALENYPAPNELILSGSSAGSLAAQVYSAVVADLWQVKANNIRYSVLADSFVGVLPPNYNAGRLISYYGTCALDMKVPAKLWDQCSNNELILTELVSYMIKNVPAAQWLFLTSIYDTTQRYYYELVSRSIRGYPFTDLISGEDFDSNVTAIIDVYENISNGISTFYVDGFHHVFLTVHDYYNNATSIPGGVFLGSFLKEWLVANSSLDSTLSTVSAYGAMHESAAVSLYSALSLIAMAVFISMDFL